MNFNKFSVSAKAASPLMPQGKDTAEYTIYGGLKFTETGCMKRVASPTAHFSSINAIITKVIGHMKVAYLICPISSA